MWNGVRRRPSTQEDKKKSLIPHLLEEIRLLSSSHCPCCDGGCGCGGLASSGLARGREQLEVPPPEVEVEAEVQVEVGQAVASAVLVSVEEASVVVVLGVVPVSWSGGGVIHMEHFIRILLIQHPI